MRRFIKTIVPTETYYNIKQVGDIYVVHLDREDNNDGSTTCYECTVNETPDINILNEELIEWKNYLSSKELEFAKKAKIEEISNYDKSDNVNLFSINDESMWLDFDERTRIRTSLEAYKSMGATNMSKWFNGIEYTFTIQQWEQMLNALEVYAAEALNVTESHKAAIDNMSTIEQINEYDFTQNYPQKLIF